MVPNGWNITTLGEHVSISSGYSPSKYNLDVKGSYPFVKVEDMNNCVKYQQFSRNYTELNGSPISKEAVIFPKRGAAIMNNKVRITATQMYLDTNMMSLLPQESLCSEFLYYTLVKEELHRIADTSTIPQINNKHILPYRFKLPPLPEQRKIAKILSTWDKAISTTERLIDNSKQQKKALMQQLLTGKKRLLDDSGKPFEGEWEEVKLGDLFSLLKSGLSRKLLDENVGVAVIRSNNMGSQFTTNKDLKYWYADDPQGANTQNYLLDDGDILINFINSLSQIGKTCIFREIGDVKSIYTTNILRAKPNTSLVQRDYLFYLTKTQRYLSHIKAITKPAVNQASFTTKDFGNFTFKIPSLLEQQKIAAVLTNTDKEIELLDQQLADLKQEKKALMQQLLTGKRRVKVDDKEVA